MEDTSNLNLVEDKEDKNEIKTQEEIKLEIKETEIKEELKVVNKKQEDILTEGIALALFNADAVKSLMEEYIEVVKHSHIIYITNHKDAIEGLFILVLPQSANCYLALKRVNGLFELLPQSFELIDNLGLSYKN